MKYPSTRKSILTAVLTAISASLVMLLSLLPGCQGQETLNQREIAKYEKIVQTNPKDVTNLGTLGGLYLQDKQYSKAIQTFQSILRIQSDDVGALSGLGMAYMAQGDKTHARQYFNGVIQRAAGTEFEFVDNRVELAHFYMGTMALEDKKFAEAEGQFRQALLSNKSDADTNFMLGKALRGEGKLSEAIDAYGQAVAFVPNMVDVYQDMAQVYGELGKSGEKSYALGMVALFQRGYDKAIDSLTKATQTISAESTLSKAWFGLGYAWEKKGDTAKAIDCYTQALKIDGSNMLARQGMSRLQPAGK